MWTGGRKGGILLIRSISYSQEEMFVGKKISNFFKSEIISSIFYLAFGLCLILIPDQTVNIICKIIFGLVMIAVGIYHIVIYTAEKQKATILDLFTGVIVMVLGIFLFFTPQIVIKILPYLLGAFILVDSIWKIKGSYRLKKAERNRWKVLLIGCLIFIALGISMLFYSFLSIKKMILFSGIILTADGVVDIVFLIMLRTGMRKAEKLRLAGEKEEADKNSAAGEYVESTAENKSGNVDTEELTEYEEMPTAVEPVKQPETETEPEVAPQTAEPDIEEETAQTEDAADADVILDEKVQEAEENMESPNREIREMLKNHDEPLEEWKD